MHIKQEQEEKMAQAGGYREELEHESKQTDPNSHAYRLIAQEIGRLNKGEDEIPATKKPSHGIPFLDLHHDKPQKVSLKIRLPATEYPRYNFVGKLLGPKGQTLKALQEQTGCKMAIMGRGSMRDKDKEEELRKEGGKYAHLEDDLHILVECYAEPIDAYHRIAEASRELKKFVIPQMEEMYDGNDGGMNAGGPAGRGRGGFRGGPPVDRGGRGGGFRGGRGAGPPPPPARGGRGGGPMPARGAPRGRGGPPPARGGGRGGAATNNSSYDGFGSQNYGSGGGYESGYDNYGGGQGGYSGGGDAQYYDYSNNQNSNYESGYAGGYDYGESWNSTGGKAAAPSTRGSTRGQGRSHPYPRQSGGNF